MSGAHITRSDVSLCVSQITLGCHTDPLRWVVGEYKHWHGHPGAVGTPSCIQQSICMLLLWTRPIGKSIAEWWYMTIHPVYLSLSGRFLTRKHNCTYAKYVSILHHTATGIHGVLRIPTSFFFKYPAHDWRAADQIECIGQILGRSSSIDVARGVERLIVLKEMLLKCQSTTWSSCIGFLWHLSLTL